ncbi:uncharacterized protein [Eurosta solidaginis]|uniref:uncharacterized protein n=1 Tax=Eurosta solidaginis TaxID=178769 RepID=UPI00353122F6
MMSYQIKSTPFFRRMLSTSKKNGQLQRLKEEYERIREFNDRSIEMKMRQVRLKRLFREIEDIKESSLQWKRRRVNADRLKTSEEIRMETLIKAKELGKEYSKMNALVDRCASRVDNVASGAAVGSISSRIELERKTRSDRRISYGNDRSRMNIQKITTTPRKPNAKPVAAADQQLIGLKEKLRTRLSFGNSCSTRNLRKKSKKDIRHKRANAGGDLSACSSFNDTEIEQTLVHEESQCQFARDAESVELPVMVLPESSTQFRDFKDLYKNNIREMFVTTATVPLNKSEEGPRERARRRWRKLALVVRHRFDTLHARRNLSSLSNQSADDSDTYELRLIPNNTDLLMSQLNVKSTSQNSENELVPGEVLLSVESLDPLESQSLPDPPSATTLTQIFDDENNPIDTRRKLQQYVKIFEPIVRDVRKDVIELGFEKLRSIFEHHNEV